MNTTIEALPDGRQTNTGAAVPILTVTERAALLECEAIIRAGRAAFIQVGHALTRIRESRLYREKHSTFEEYCLVEWEITDRFARNLRSAADVVDVLQEKKFGVLPLTESQARPLTKLPREEWSHAWEQVLSTAPNGRVTASHVTAVVQQQINRLAGLPTDTEVFQKPAVARQKPTDAGTREEKILAAADGARAKLRELRDLIRTADGTASANVELAIQYMDALKDHTQRVQELQANRKAEI